MSAECVQAYYFHFDRPLDGGVAPHNPPSTLPRSPRLACKQYLIVQSYRVPQGEILVAGETTVSVKIWF